MGKKYVEVIEYRAKIWINQVHLQKKIDITNIRTKLSIIKTKIMRFET